MKRFPVFRTAEDENNRWKRLSLGSGVSVPTEEILGIFDMDTATVSPVTKKFLNTAQKNGCVSVAGEELPKSFVVTSDRPLLKPGKSNKSNSIGKTQTHVMLSQFAPSTLVGRERNL